MTILAQSGGYGKPLMECKVGTIPTKAYVPAVISAYEYVWVDPKDFHKTCILTQEEMKKVDDGSYSSHPLKEIKVAYYVSVPTHDCVARINQMGRTVHGDKSKLRRLAMSALGQDGLSITHCEQLIGCEVDCLFEKKTSSKGKIYPVVKDFAAKE